MYRGVTPEAFRDWLTPRQAVQLLDSALGNNSYSYISKHTLLQRIRSGLIRTVAAKSTRSDKPEEIIQLGDIPRDHWSHVQEDDIFWTSGDLTYSRRDGARHLYDAIDFGRFDVRFEPESVRAVIAPAEKHVAVQSPKPPQEAQVAEPKPPLPAKEFNKGGRPRKDFWDDFWIEICGQIYEGTLRPKTQAELERAMHEWIETKGHEAGETVVKAAARKLFRAWKLAGGN